MSILTRLALGLPADPWAGALQRTGDAVRVRRLVGAAAECGGLVAVVGRRGSGKTSAVRAAVAATGALAVEPCRLDRERLHIGDIVTALVIALGDDERPRHGAELRAAQARRLLGRRKGRVVLVVDDAERLAGATLRAIKRLREWSFGGRSPLLAVVLAGQERRLVAVPEVDLRTSSMVMAGLTRAEAEAAVTSALGRVCPPAAAARIAAAAGGNWLDLQQVADRALAEANAAGAAEVTPAAVDAATGEAPDTPAAPGPVEAPAAADLAAVLDRAERGTG